MFKIKNKQINLFETSTLSKKSFSWVSFLTAFSISLFILFQINTLPIKSEELMHLVWIIFILLIVWHTSRMSNYNLHISHQKIIMSYIVAIFVNIYLYLLVFWNIEDTPLSWSDFQNLYYWILPIPLINIAWKIIIIIFGYNVRPFFMKKIMFNTIITFLLTILLVLAEYVISNYLIQSKTWNYLEPLNIFILYMSGIIMTGIIILVIYKNIKFRLYGKKENIINKQVLLWSSFMKLGSITIWFLSSMKHLILTYREISFIVLGIVLISAIIVLATFKRIKGYSGNFLLFSTTSIFIMNISAFFLNNYLDANISMVLAILLFYVLLYQLINILVVIHPPWMYISAYKFFTSSLITYASLIWITINLVGINIDSLPFNIPKMISIIFGTSSILLELVVLYSYFVKFIKISSNSKRLYKHLNKKGFLNE